MNVKKRIRRESVCMCVCGGDGEEVCLRLRGREEERGLSKEDESENQVCT